MRLRMEVQLNVDGHKEWNRIIAQPIWSNDGQHTYRGAIGVVSNIHRDYIRMLKLEKQVKQDDVTGLYNQKYAKQQIQQQLRNQKLECAMLLLDADDLKKINDNHGHEAGNRYLLKVADKIRSSVRKGDVVARVGGDEFLIFIRYKFGADTIVERIFQQITEGEDGISMCMGAATTKEHGKTFRELFHRADAALHVAKEAGRGQYRFYDDSMEDVLSSDAEDVNIDWRPY